MASRIPTRASRRSWTLWAVGAAIVAAAGGGAWWWKEGRMPEASYRTAKLERGPISATVSASGAVTPVTQVSVGTQVSGQIKELYVDFNSEVKAGQLIARIDPETFEYRVRQAEADVDAAQAAVLTAQANTAASRAAISRANVDLVEARRDAERKTMLVGRQFIAQSEADKANALVTSSQESVRAAQAQAAVTDAQVKSARANVAQRQAALAQSRIDLERTRITSPVNGIVIKRAVEKGQTVAASLQAPELFVIAQNLQDMQVEASVDESDVGRIRTGQKASFTVDAFPGMSFDGSIRQVRKAAQNVANVVTYVAVVGFSNESGRLLPGMTANVRVVTDSRDDVLKVANAALRVRIAGLETPGGAGGPARGASAVGSGPWLPSANAQPAAAGASGPPPSGPGAELRNRLVAELGLAREQVEKVDAIYAEARPRFAQLRELPPDERGKARERVMADIRARIGDVLTPAQKVKYAALQAEGGGGRQAARGRIYLMDEAGKPRPVDVRLGITDGTSTEILIGANAPDAALLKEGATVVIGVVQPGGAATAARPGGGGPRLPF